jgi:hypothetical protein
MNIEAMKQWLEALEGLVDLAHEAGFPCDRAEAAITSLRQAIEQAEKQEPVAWFEESPLGEWFLAYTFNPNAKTEPLYTTPQPQREWVGLTDEEIQICWDSVMDGAVFTRRDVYNAIEAKLKEKNT